MSIRFYCPSGHRLNVSEKLAGQKIRCPRCKEKAVVPEASQSDSTNGTRPKSTAKSEQEPTESEQPPKDKTEEGAEARQSPKDQEESAANGTAAQRLKSAQPEHKKSRSKPPPLPAARKAAAEDDPTQPKQKPVPKVEVPDRQEPGHDHESVLDSEAPSRPKERLKPQRASRRWTKSESPKVPPKLPTSKAPPDAGQQPSDQPKKPPPKPPPKTEPAHHPEPELADEVHKQEADKQEERPSRRRGRRDRKRSKREGRDEAAERETTSNEPPETDAASRHPAREAKPKKTRRRRGPKMMPLDVYRADRGSLTTVKGLAVILALVVLFSLLPVGWLAVSPNSRNESVAASDGEADPASEKPESYINLEKAPPWARIVMLIAVLQLFYIAWMLTSPDWGGVWVVMVVFALVSTAYGMATAMAIAWPIEEPMPLRVEPDLRWPAKYWCGSVLAVMSLATYLCGRTSAKWRRTCELELAGRERARLRG